MRDLRGFREAVRVHRRAVGHTQRQLAKSIGLHPDVLSHKLNGSDNAMLTTQDVIGIATTLAGWGALATRTDVYALLDLAGVPRHAIPAAAWSAPPLTVLRDIRDDVTASRTISAPASGIPEGPAVSPGQPAAPRPRVTPTPLPASATQLIGRERERAEVAAAVGASRLVTLTGVGGTGKTRLALQAAHDLAGNFADGVAFIDVAPVRDPALIATTLARELGLAPPSAETAETHLIEALQSREMLLLVDNFEHLLDAVQLLARMLVVCPAIRLLTTSRIALRLYGEHTVRVPPLYLPGDYGSGLEDSEAVRLFIARARAVCPGFAPQEDELAATAEICAALDGLPLAIELAAARIRLYPPLALLPMLRSRLALLTGGPRDLPQRQQTLRATLDWSHDLLPAHARRLFAYLGVFAGSFDAAAASAVSGDPEPFTTLENLADLADQSLLEVTAGQPPSFRMLQTVREYSLARLAETGEQDAASQRHLAYFLNMALATHTGLDGPGQAGFFDQLEAAYPNLRAALEFADREAGHDSQCLADGLRLAAALGPLWQRRGPLAEGMLQLDRLLARDDAQQRPSDPVVRASAVLAACSLACFKGDYARTVDLARHGIELCAPLSDHRGLALAYRFLGEAALAVGDDDEAEPNLERELAEARQAGDVLDLATAYNMVGQAARHRGEIRHATSLIWQALKLFREAGDPNGVSTMLASLGELARDAGQPLRTWRLYGAALRRHAELGNKRHMAYELEGLAAAAALGGAGQQALVYVGAAQVLREETGGLLPPAERVILDRVLAPALAPLSARERQAAISRGRNQPLPTTIEHALRAAGNNGRPSRP
ncbi:MAG: AAA family ATPase [Streptosporangiaceae bacterium]